VRAPTPKAFDRLVKRLEDNDSVVFESIALPGIPREPSDAPLAARRSDSDDTAALKKRITETIAMNQRKDETIADRDAQITSLRRDISRIQGAPARPTTSRAMRGPNDDDDLEHYYRSQYETTLFRYEKLKEALAGGVRRSHPAPGKV